MPATQATTLAMSRDAPPPPCGKRKTKEAQPAQSDPQEFQQKKREIFIAELMAKGCELRHAQVAVANARADTARAHCTEPRSAHARRMPPPRTRSSGLAVGPIICEARAS